MDQLFTSLLSEFSLKGLFELCPVPETQGELCANALVSRLVCEWVTSSFENRCIKNGCRDAWVPSYRATSLPRSNFKFLTTPGPEAPMFWTLCPPPTQNILHTPLSTSSLLPRGLKLQYFGIFNQK